MARGRGDTGYRGNVLLPGIREENPELLLGVRGARIAITNGISHRADLRYCSASVSPANRQKATDAGETPALQFYPLVPYVGRASGPPSVMCFTDQRPGLQFQLLPDQNPTAGETPALQLDHHLPHVGRASGPPSGVGVNNDSPSGIGYNIRRRVKS